MLLANVLAKSLLKDVKLLFALQNSSQVNNLKLYVSCFFQRKQDHASLCWALILSAYHPSIAKTTKECCF